MTKRGGPWMTNGGGPSHGQAGKKQPARKPSRKDKKPKPAGKPKG